MAEETKEKIRLTVKDILLTFFDGMAEVQSIFGYHYHRQISREYWKWRNTDKANFQRKLWQLKKQKYIKEYKLSQKTAIRLTSLGKKKALEYLSNDFQIKPPKHWDRKWRIVIFDIPEEKKVLREITRERLKRWGFYQLQKSVFVYPFECQEMISALKYIYDLEKYMQYIIADSIETEIDLVEYFYNKEILPEKLK